MHVHVYKSLRRADTFIYLVERDAFERLPDALREMFGTLQFVIDFELTPDRRLAREDTATVRANLETRGFHVQHPPELHARHAD